MKTLYYRLIVDLRSLPAGSDFQLVVNNLTKSLVNMFSQMDSSSSMTNLATRCVMNAVFIKSDRISAGFSDDHPISVLNAILTKLCADVSSIYNPNNIDSGLSNSVNEILKSSFVHSNALKNKLKDFYATSSELDFAKILKNACEASEAELRSDDGKDPFILFPNEPVRSLVPSKITKDLLTSKTGKVIFIGTTEDILNKLCEDNKKNTSKSVATSSKKNIVNTSLNNIDNAGNSSSDLNNKLSDITNSLSLNDKNEDSK